jgi:hypothetical protein
MQITAIQREYLKALDGGAQTTGELVMSMSRSRNSIAAMMLKLRKKGLVHSSRMYGQNANIWRHELIGDGSELNAASAPSHRISRELYEIAELSDDGYMGQRCSQSVCHSGCARPAQSWGLLCVMLF